MIKLTVLWFRGREFRGLGFCSECVEPFAPQERTLSHRGVLLDNQTLGVTVRLERSPFRYVSTSAGNPSSCRQDDDVGN